MIGSEANMTEETKKRSTSVRLTPEALRLLALLNRKLGVNQSGVIELAIRRLAQAEGVE
jgi:hypothetical protein